MQVNYCLVHLITYITHSRSTFATRPHGSSGSGDPGLVRLGGCGGESACQLLCGGRTGRGRGVHLGIPRTGGQALRKRGLIPTFCVNCLQNCILSMGLTGPLMTLLMLIIQVSIQIILSHLMHKKHTRFRLVGRQIRRQSHVAVHPLSL